MTMTLRAATLSLLLSIACNGELTTSDTGTGAVDGTRPDLAAADAGASDSNAPPDRRPRDRTLPPDKPKPGLPTLAQLWTGKAKFKADQTSVPVEGGPGHREAFAVARPDISATTVYMYHRCFMPKGKTSICLSISSNKGDAFQVFKGVIISPDAGHIFSVAPAVAKLGSKWVMVYEESHVAALNWAESSDGVTWSKKGQLLKHGKGGAWDQGALATPGILVEGGKVYVFYAGFPLGGKNMSVGFASGKSMSSLVKHPGNPVFKPPASGWDRGQHSMARLLREGSYVYMVYEGADTDFTCEAKNRYGWGMARSTDLVNWSPLPSNPLGLSAKKPHGCGNDMPSIYRRQDGHIFVYHTSADTKAIVREVLVAK